MANNCLVTKLKNSVNNPALPVYGEVVFEMINQPSGVPQRSGSVTVQSPVITTTVRILDNDLTNTFLNGSGRSFVIDNNAEAVSRGLGNARNTKVGIYPGSNVILNEFNEHIKEVPSSIGYATSITYVSFNTTSDKTDSSYAYNFDSIKNAFKIPKLIHMYFHKNLSYQGSIEQILIAAHDAYSNRDTFFLVATQNSDTIYTGITFNNQGIIGIKEFVIKPSDTIMNVYTGGHYGEPEYLLATYDGSTWTYNS